MSIRWVSGFAGICLSAVIGLGAGAAFAADEPALPKCAYVGVSGCRICHNSKTQGEQTVIWKGTKHATAYETLKTDEAIKMGAARGLKKPPVESAECLRCHATGWNLTEEQKAQFLKPAFKIEDGVQCETCHGPGEKYRTLTMMKNRQAALEAGMILGDEKLCRTCHNDQSPAWKPDRYTTKDGQKVGFDYAGCWDKIKHPVPKAAQ